MHLHEATTLVLTGALSLQGPSFPLPAQPLRSDQYLTSDFCCLFWTLHKRIQTVYTYCVWLFSNMQRFYEYVHITHLLRHCPVTRKLLICQTAAVCSPQNVSSKDTHIGNKRIPGCLLCFGLPVSTSAFSQRERSFHWAFSKEGDTKSFCYVVRRKVKG